MHKRIQQGDEPERITKRVRTTSSIRTEAETQAVIQPTKFGTVRLVHNGFQMIGLLRPPYAPSMTTNNTTEALASCIERIAPHNYPLNLGTDTRYLTCYETVPLTEQLYMIVAEIQQNVMDWTTQELYRRVNVRHPPSSIAKSIIDADDQPDEVRLGLATFTDQVHGLYGTQHCSTVVDARQQTIRLSSLHRSSLIKTTSSLKATAAETQKDDKSSKEKEKEKVTRKLLVTQGLTPASLTNEDKQQPDDDWTEVYWIQWGMQMLPAERLHLATTTKENPSDTTNSTVKLPLAGGHGVGLKQSMALFASRAWAYQTIGTIPGTHGQHVARWSAVQDGAQLGIKGQVLSRSALQWPATWPADVLKWLKQTACPFLCTRIRLPRERGWPSTPSTQSIASQKCTWTCTRPAVWNALIHSNIHFVLASSSPNSSSSVLHESENQQLALIQPAPRVGVSACYLNGTPILFHGLTPDRPQSLHVLAVTDSIREYSREERAYSAHVGYRRILDQVLRVMEEPLRLSGSELTNQEFWPDWLTTILHQTYKDSQSPQAGLTFQIHSGAVQRAAACLAKLTGCITYSDWKEAQTALARCKPPVTIPSNRIIRTDDPNKQRFYEWIQRDHEHYSAWDPHYPSDIDKGFHFTSCDKFVQQHYLNHAKLVPVQELNPTRAGWLPIVQQLIQSFSPYIAVLKDCQILLWSDMSIGSFANPLADDAKQDAYYREDVICDLLSIDAAVSLDIPKSFQHPNIILWDKNWARFQHAPSMSDWKMVRVLLDRIAYELPIRCRDTWVEICLQYLRTLIGLGSLSFSTSSTSSPTATSVSPTTVLDSKSVFVGLHTWMGQWMQTLLNSSSSSLSSSSSSSSLSSAPSLSSPSTFTFPLSTMNHLPTQSSTSATAGHMMEPTRQQLQNATFQLI